MIAGLAAPVDQDLPGAVAHHPEGHQRAIRVAGHFVEADRFVPIERGGDVGDRNHRSKPLHRLAEFAHARSGRRGRRFFCARGFEPFDGRTVTGQHGRFHCRVAVHVGVLDCRAGFNRAGFNEDTEDFVPPEFCGEMQGRHLAFKPGPAASECSGIPCDNFTHRIHIAQRDRREDVMARAALREKVSDFRLIAGLLADDVELVIVASAVNVSSRIDERADGVEMAVRRRPVERIFVIAGFARIDTRACVEQYPHHGGVPAFSGFVEAGPFAVRRFWALPHAQARHLRRSGGARWRPRHSRRLRSTGRSSMSAASRLRPSMRARRGSRGRARRRGALGQLR